MSVVTIALLIVGFVLLVVGAEILVRGASKLAIAAGLSPLVVGLTVVAYGTSAPELAVSLQSSFAGQADIAIGNIVGSNIANILLILGITATVSPLFVAKQLVRLDVPLMIGVSVLMLLMGFDGNINSFEGGVLVLGAIAYTVFTLYQCRQENIRQEKADLARETEDAKHLPDASQGVSSGDLLPPETRRKESANPLVRIGSPLVVMAIGIALLVVGANLMVNGAIAIAEYLGISELIIGLTIVAIGTSLPEIATCVAATLKGERDMAVGNAVGSNIFNILLVIGLCSIVTPGGLEVSPSAIRFDMPIMIAVAVACLPIFFTGYMVLRQEGILFLAYYVAYTLYLFLYATEHGALEEYSTVMVVFVVPITLLTLIGLAVQAWRHGHHGHRD
ncbi:MAG: calcium/sodium antiporter [Elainellaceae cyanobacterium]